MAGLIGLTASDIDIQDAVGAIRWKYEGEWIPHPVVRLTTTLPVAVNGGEQGDGEREVVRARWGFPVGPRPVGNARDDRLQQSPMWSKLLGQPWGHCLFASSGIYEMIKDDDGNKQAYWFRRRGGGLIVMPGLCQPRRVKDNDLLCAAIITTEPNRLFGHFHPRQVCSLEPGQLDAWMQADPDEAMELLGPAPDDALEAVPVDKRIFGSGRREMEDLVPVGDPLHWPLPEVIPKPAGAGQAKLDFGGG